MRVLVVGNAGDDDAGYVGGVLEEQGARLVTVQRENAVNVPDPSGFDAVVSLGSDWSVYADHVSQPVARETALLRDAVSAGRPVLGLCFGGQLLAHALGGTVERAPRPEIGWYDVETDVPELIPPGPYVQWHSDRFTAPPGSTELARSAVGPQAFVSGRSLGLQFHPEATAAIVGRWCAGMADQLARVGTTAEEFVTECVVREVEARDRAAVIVETFLSGALVGGRP